MNKEEILWDRIFYLKFMMIVFVVLDIILFALFLILCSSGELAGSICTGIFFCILLGSIILCKKKEEAIRNGTSGIQRKPQEVLTPEQLKGTIRNTAKK